MQAGSEELALEALEQSLAAVERSGLVGPFVELAPWTGPLLRRALPHTGRASLVAELLRLVGAESPGVPGAPGAPAQAPVRQATRAPQPLLEPLTERELEVLRLLAGGASNQEIADRLFVALTTVKKHVGNIFGKLGAANRVQAMTRAQELGLL